MIKRFLKRLVTSNNNTIYAELYWEIAPYLDDNWYKNTIICQTCGYEHVGEEFCMSCGSSKVLSFMKAYRLAKEMW